MRTALALCAVVVLWGVGGCKKEEAPAKPADISKYGAYLTNYPFGGRRMEWWNERLKELSPTGSAPDPAMYALVVDRAKKNGLDVVDEGGEPKVHPNKLTTALLLDRLGVK